MFCGADFGWFCWTSSFFFDLVLGCFFWFWMISRPRGEIGVVAGLHLQAKQWQQAEVVFQAGSEALPKGDSVQPHFSKKRHESNIAGFNNFAKEVQQQFPLSMFHHFILQFCVSFPKSWRPARRQRRRNWSRTLSRGSWDQEKGSIWWMGWTTWENRWNIWHLWRSVTMTTN